MSGSGNTFGQMFGGDPDSPAAGVNWGGVTTEPIGLFVVEQNGVEGTKTEFRFEPFDKQVLAWLRTYDLYEETADSEKIKCQLYVNVTDDQGNTGDFALTYRTQVPMNGDQSTGNPCLEANRDPDIDPDISVNDKPIDRATLTNPEGFARGKYKATLDVGRTITGVLQDGWRFVVPFSVGERTTAPHGIPPQEPAP